MKKILVIEDDAKMRQNVLTILQMENFEVLTATNGVAGIALAQEQKPDLILCDIMMPKADGHEVIRQLRADEDTASIPIIFLTAKTDVTDRRAGMNQGADDYLTKPITVPELLAAIEARLRRRQELTNFKPSFESAKPLESLGLTPREAEVLFWCAQGKTNAEIALILDLSVGTVKKHMEHILVKMAAENRAVAALRALEQLGRNR